MVGRFIHLLSVEEMPRSAYMPLVIAQWVGTVTYAVSRPNSRLSDLMF